jgi:predicted nuclease with TOPRIM domain
MIRIKDYIFNENDIKVIENDEDLLTIIFKDGSYRETQGTFNDIEWNYGTTELEELKLDYSAVVSGYKKLEEENKKLKSAMKDTYDSANDTCGELQQRIKELEEENNKLISQTTSYKDLYDTLNGRCNKLMKYIDSLEEDKIITPLYANHIRDIVRSGF